MSVRAVLFDLDGTLADTAPDLAAALNLLRVESGLEPLPPDAMRAYTSSGARGLLGIGFGISREDARYGSLKERFLDLYAEGLCIHTRLFEGIPELLERIESLNLAWGIVTNKAMRFTDPLVKKLKIAHRARCIVSGDTTAKTKPHPDSLLHATRALGIAPDRCLYIGDDLRDVQAARSAGMAVLAAAYGYLGADGNPHHWQADAVIAHPLDALTYL